MIFVTGDTHIPIDINKLNTKRFPQQKELTKKDYVIICGDFGGVWDNSNEEKYWLNWLNEKPFTTLFIDGNHENFDLLNSYPIDLWNGGMVHKISDSIIHLMRGQIYFIDELSFFCFGGAASIDKAYRTEQTSWWKEEVPNKQEFNCGIENLEKHNYTVDIVLTHTTPYSISATIHNRLLDDELELLRYLEFIYTNVNYKKWFCGHHHIDQLIDERLEITYDKIHQIS